MNAADILTYCVAVAIATASPGPAIATVVARTLNQGLKSGFIMGLGLVTGDLVYFVFAVTGLAGVVAVMSDAFVVLKLGGAFYIIYIGVLMVWTRANALDDSVSGRAANLGSGENAAAVFLSGLTITLANPKTMFFFLAILPNLLDLQDVDGALFVLLGVLLFVISLGGLMCYGAVASAAGRAATGGRFAMWLNRAAGLILIVCGIFLLMRIWAP
ncbi:MAG: LysE family translocator [Pseudomonadota bacterium]